MDSGDESNYILSLYVQGEGRLDSQVNVAGDLLSRQGGVDELADERLES